MKKFDANYSKAYKLKNQLPKNLFLFAVYHITGVMGQSAASISDIKAFYKENKLSEPSNFGGEISQLTRKPKKIIKRKEGYQLTQLSKKWINSQLSADPDDEGEVQEFLMKSMGDFNIDNLDIDPSLRTVIQQRINEVQRCIAAKAPLASIFLCGSTLEGLLLSYANKHAKVINQTKVAPKDKTTGKVLALPDWKLSHLIDAAREISLIDEDTWTFSSSLREFRNYIHPNQQAKKNFSPTMETADICFKVLKSVIIQLGGK